MNFQSLVIFVLTCFYASFSIHKGYHFKSWSKDFRNGFHLGLAFAVLFAMIEYLLSFLTDQ